MSTTDSKQINRKRRHNRVRAKVSGTAECPRLAVYRSNKCIYVQLIDDVKAVTLGATDSRKVTGENARARASAVGTEIANIAKKIGIEKVVFDRGGFLYTGSIKEVAEGARKGGLTF
jgi:large subunit ribosomal protein L18